MGTTGTRVRIPEQDDRLRGIQNVTQVALSLPEELDYLWELLDRTKKILGTDSAAVLLLDRRSGELVAASAVGQEDEVHQRVRLPLSQRLAEMIAEECRPVAIADVDHSQVLNPILLTTETRSLLGVPLMDGGTVIGQLHVGSQTRREFTDADAELLQFAADRAAQITQVEYSPAAGLQRSMLPSALPDIPGLELAARYVPGHGKIGGDWYDVFVLPTGEPCAVIGDVAGSGLQAAVIMDRLRTALRSYALETRDPADILTRLDHHVQHFEQDVIATVLCAVFHPGLDKVEISSAGHFPPVSAAPGRAPELADIVSDQLIGVSPVQRRATTIAVPPGTTLCLYTDGLVERRGRDLDEGQELLRRAVTTGPPRASCDAVMQDLVGHDKADDDIAILMMRRVLLDRLQPRSGSRPTRILPSVDR
jgi:phosphoserine phosphatase RsbU/P